MRHLNSEVIQDVDVLLLESCNFAAIFYGIEYLQGYQR
jgi:hypothetical protein